MSTLHNERAAILCQEHGWVGTEDSADHAEEVRLRHLLAAHPRGQDGRPWDGEILIALILPE